MIYLNMGNILPDFFWLATESNYPADLPMVVAGVLLSLAVIYTTSKIGGELFNKLGFPPVLGELVGGVIIGVSGLKLLMFPGEFTDVADSYLIKILELTAGLDPSQAIATFNTQGEVIEVLSELGVIILLFEIGIESNLRDLIKVGWQSLIVAVVGVTLPFVAGTAGLVVIFHLPVIPAVFAGAALTATSIGITSRVLLEIKCLSTNEGQIILGAAVIDDILGIIILAVVASLAKTGEIDLVNLIVLIVSAVVFLVGAILLGRWLNKTFIFFAEKFTTRGRAVIPGLILALLLAYIGAAIHLEAILGAFAAGLILDNLDETDVGKELEELIRPIADVLVPIFFVCVGAKTDLSVINPAVPANREGLVIAIFLVVVAILGKIACGYSVFGFDQINRLAIGVGMIPRGEVGLVFAAIGTASGTLSPSLNVAIIMMVILTTFIAPPLLRVVMKPDELANPEVSG